MIHPEYTKQLHHLSTLAEHPGWKAYVWERLQELDQVPLFAGIKADVVAEVERRKAEAGKKST